VSDVYQPTDRGDQSKAFISGGYDATTHFETVMLDVMDMYKRITGKDLDLEMPDEE
jgi:Rab GDP dissociation inhibitor